MYESFVHYLCCFRLLSFTLNKPKMSSTTTMNKHTSPGYSLLTHCFFDGMKIGLIAIEVKAVRKGFVRI